MKTSYTPLLRRRREGVTDYRARKRAIISQKVLLVVRVSNKNVSSQFVQPSVKGDLILASAHSHELTKSGWRGSMKSTPACYLLGLLAGRRAMARGIKEAVLYNGLAPFVKGGRIGAFAKGVVDAGVALPVGQEGFPEMDRISGKAISEYASSLSGEADAADQNKFGGLRKMGFKPEEYPANFEKTKAAILGVKV